MVRPKNSERQDVRALILQKAKELFFKEGYHKITIRKIAKEIGYSPATIYLYFKNKDELLFELHNEGFKLLYKRKMALPMDESTDPVERLRLGARMYIDFALDNPEYYEVMFNMPEPRDFLEQKRSSAQDGELVDYAMLSYDFLRQGVDRLQAAGYLTEVDRDTLTFSLWSTVHGLVSLIIRKRIPYPQAPSRELAYRAIEFLMSSMAQSKDARPKAGE